ncbi:MAG TPA: hypothetical protein VKU80_06155 [Planctomycetota bacterium]|nr:hypothetical protein [Planctomycetota bacterium]
MTTAVMMLLSLLASFDDKDDLSSGIKKLTDAKSFSFKGQVTLIAPARGGNAPEPRPLSYEGKYAEGVGLVIETDTDEIVRVDGKTAIRPKPTWRVIEDGAQGNRGAGGGGGFAAAFGRGGPGMFARSPKDELANLEGKLDKVTKTDRKENVGEVECSVYEVSLTSEGAKSLAGPGGRPGGGGGQNVEVEASANGHFWIASDGRLAKYDLSTKATRSFNNREFTTQSTRTVTFFDVEKTKFELPAGAKEAINK